MAQDKPKAATVAVTLTCILSGGDVHHNAGETIQVDAAEAARLIEIGAAVAAPETAKE